MTTATASPTQPAGHRRTGPTSPSLAQHGLGSLGVVGVEEGVAAVEVDDGDAGALAEPAGVGCGQQLVAVAGVGFAE